MMRGLPASGKSSKSQEIMKADGNCIRVNRDLLREMLHFGKWSGKNEGEVIAVEKLIVRDYLMNNKNVIVDDTNLGDKNETMWREFSKDIAKFEIEDVTTDWAECVQRDASRPKPVGKAVIINMAMRNGLIAFEKDSVVLCDLDGTLCDIGHRLSFVKNLPEGQKKDWKKFFEAIEDDKLRESTAQILYDAIDAQKEIVFVSARPDTYRKETELWLKNNFNDLYTTLIMRNGGDTREDTIVKKEILDTYFKDTSVIHKVIDDRPSVIRMWKEQGLNVVDVGNGVDF